LKIAFVDGRFNLSCFRSYETIAWFSSPSRLWVEGGVEKSRVMPTELRELRGGLGRKITVFRKPSGIPAIHELVHSDHVHGQTSWRAGKAFDKPWKSSYNFSTRLFNPSFSGSSATTAKSELAYDAPSIIRAYSSSFCSRSGIRKTHATVHIHEVDVCLQCANGGGTNEKYTPVLPLLLSFLRENTFPLNFQRQSCRHV